MVIQALPADHKTFLLANLSCFFLYLVYREHGFLWGYILIDLMGFNLTLYILFRLPARRLNGPLCRVISTSFYFLIRDWIFWSWQYQDSRLTSSRGRRWMQQQKSLWRRNRLPIQASRSYFIMLKLYSLIINIQIFLNIIWKGKGKRVNNGYHCYHRTVRFFCFFAKKPIRTEQNGFGLNRFSVRSGLY